MADPFRIPSSYGKIPGFSTKKEYDRVIHQIRLMEPSTAFLTVQTVVIPALSGLQTARSMESVQSQRAFFSPSSSDIPEMRKNLKELENNLRGIQDKLNNLQSNKNKILDDWKKSIRDSPIQLNDKIFTEFYYLRDNLTKHLDTIKQLIQKLKKDFANRSSGEKKSLQDLEKVYESLQSKVLESDPQRWNQSSGRWREKSGGEALRFWIQTEAGGKGEVVYWKGKEPKNPLGFLEMVTDSDQTKFNEYMSLITNGLGKVGGLLTPVKVDSILSLEGLKGIEKIKTYFKDIEKRINDLKTNHEKIMSFLVGKNDKNLSKLTDEENGPFSSGNKGLFGDFFTARGFIKDRIAEINKAIKDVAKYLPNSPLLKRLKQSAENLLKNIPNPSDRWNKDTLEYDGKSWVHKYIERKSFWNVHWRGDKGGHEQLENPIGLLEMTQDPKKLGDYLSNVTNSLKEIDRFSSTQEFHLMKLKHLDTQSAYIYLITTLLPHLQSESAKDLEEQGKTMKEISKAFDKWNEIQEDINEFVKVIHNIKEKGLIDESGDLEVTLIHDYESEYDGKNYKIVHIKDSDQSFKALIDAKKSLDAKIGEMQTLLKDLENKLPASQQSLIATMKELTSQLVLKKNTKYTFYYHPSGDSDLRFEVREEYINLPNNEDFDFMRKFIASAMRDEYLFMVDADQTQFKAYMDNIAQGITALTSISNMAQQEIQIATQYYNSLLGLQKNALDSLNKVIQVATRNPNY